MTAQYKDVEALYSETQKNLKGKPDSQITNMSGFSQSGPAVAKVAAKHKVDKITNFMDWGSKAALQENPDNPREHNDITKSEKKWIDKHAHIYSDSGKDVTEHDGSDGEIDYGKIQTFEDKDHDTQAPHIKGNGLDVDWYVEKHKFCSGMTKEQVKEVAKYKAAHDGKKSKKDEQDYIDDYYDEYSDTTKSKKVEETSASAANLLDSQRAKISALPTNLYKHGKGKTGRGGKSVLLKPEGIPGITAKAKASAQRAEAKLHQTMEETKHEVHQIIEQTRNEAFSIAPDLSSGEIEGLLAEIDFNNCWDEGAESSDFSKIKQFVAKVEKLAASINETSDTFQSTDESEARGMTFL